MALGDLVVRMSADIAQFQSDMGRALHLSQQNARKIQQAFDGVRNTLASIGAGVSVAGLVAFTKSAIDSADNLNKLSQKVGVAVESLSALKYAADLSDVSMEQLQTGLQRLAKGAVEAQAGTGDAAEAFRALKISVTDSSGGLKTTEQLLLEVAEKFSNMEDGAGKTALAMRIFGKSGAELIPLLNQGKGGIEALRKEAERLGIVLSSETARAAEQFNDDMKRLTAGSERLKVELAGGLLPVLNKLVQELLAAKEVMGGNFWAGLALSAGTQTSDPVGQLNKITGTLEKLKKTRAELVQNQSLAGRMFAGVPFFGVDSDVQDINKQIAVLEKQRELLTKVATAQGERDNFDLMGGRGKGKAPPLGGGGGEADKIKEINKSLVTAAEQILGLDKESLEKRDEMLRKDEELRKAEEKLGQTMQEQVLKNIDAERELYEERERTAGLLANNGKSMIQINEENAKALNKQNDIARELGMTFTSAFEDAVIGGKKLGDVFRSLAQDIGRIGMRKLIVEPLFEAVSKAFDLKSIMSSLGGGGGGGDGGGGIFGFLGSLFGGGGGGGIPGLTFGTGDIVGAFADGGTVPRTGLALVHAGEEIITAGESGRGSVFHVDMRGADVEAVARLERLVMQVNGSIEPRAVAAMSDHSSRGRR